MNIIQTLEKEGLIHPPLWLSGNIQFLTMMGSYAYGVSENNSDIDIYGFCIPPREVIFPHLAGKIIGFDKDLNQFDQWQQHHIKFENKTYDFQIFNIVKYFSLLRDNNPNIIDSIFVPDDCVLYQTQIGELVRKNRKLFLHKGSYYKFFGYAHSQKGKLKSEKPSRLDIVEKYGFDTKFAYHIVRLIQEIGQILQEGDLNLRKYSNILKDVREGKWSIEKIEELLVQKEKEFKELYDTCNLPHSPNNDKIRELLLQCV